MSVKEGKRIEIKGFQDVAMMIKTIDNEIKRQLSLIEEKKEVKAEVRNALPNGETEFLRPLPGSARMYPETDLPLLKISKSFIDEAKKSLPKLRDEIEEELAKTGLSQEMISLLFKENKFEDFKELSKIIDNPMLIAKTLLIFPKEIAKHEKVSMKEAEIMTNRDVLSMILENVKSKKISENQIKEVLERIAQGKKPEEAIVFEKHDLENAEEKILKIIKGKPGLSENAYMGLVMKEMKGLVDGQTAREIIKKYVK
jgi:glutamyl-tRNA(Gln) amidotransferase subunit E